MTNADIGDAYELSAPGWRRGAEQVYARLADALVASAPVAGTRVLDVGAGTAVAGAAAMSAGAARVVAVDLATGMLRLRDPGVLAAAADAARLPFGAGTFDLAVAALCLGHLPDPGTALVELHRVAGAVVASAFAPGWTHPAKAVVDEVMVGFGFTLPDWYRRVKGEGEAAITNPNSWSRLATGAGFTTSAAHVVEVDSGLRTPAEIVAWRFGMAHLAPFVATLADPQRDRARAAAEDAVADVGPVLIPLLVLSAS